MFIKLLSNSFLVLLIIIAATSIAVSQHYDTVATNHFSDLALKHGGKLNYTDENGLKQGYWVEYKECSSYQVTHCFNDQSPSRPISYIKTGKEFI